MLLIFHLGRPDILPVDDFGVRAGFQYTYGLRKMPAPKALALYGERWGPHRSAAAWYLWRACELKRAGKLPEPLEQVRLPRMPKRRRRAAGKAGAKKATARTARAATTVRTARAGARKAARSARRVKSGSTKSGSTKAPRKMRS